MKKIRHPASTRNVRDKMIKATWSGIQAIPNNFLITDARINVMEADECTRSCENGEAQRTAFST